MILIFSGPIQSHKTTSLMRWVSTRTDCGGILSPDKDGLRQLYHIKEGKTIDWQKQAVSSSTDVLVGRFVFDAAAFELAEFWLDQQLNDPEIKTLILDEVGPLELSGKGWDTWIKQALPNIGEKTLIIVVRETLVEKVVRHYAMEEYSVVDRDYFME